MPLLAPFVALAVRGVAALRPFFHRDSTKDAADILALLWARDTTMKQSDIVRSKEITMADVARALVRLEELGLVRREWDNSACTYLVQAAISREGKAQ
jgi:DNA-binding IclR family transcriptional regulator